MNADTERCGHCGCKATEEKRSDESGSIYGGSIIRTLVKCGNRACIRSDFFMHWDDWQKVNAKSAPTPSPPRSVEAGAVGMDFHSYVVSIAAPISTSPEFSHVESPLILDIVRAALTAAYGNAAPTAPAMGNKEKEGSK